ncbi:MAG: hypothetical protein DMD37_06810 [Gemmatimonadetes bacterium]|nr:MAG: hypothetical protein DMD68_00020 [Gemmatimonadota bacterium]PYP63281.1 MAG: hypothetical protein DMD37_06810 [Gemmatimonadota bacterium]
MSEPSLRSLPSAPLLGAPRARPSQWEAAFAAHYVALCEYVLRFVGSAETAEDIVQDLFLHLWDTRGPRDVLRLTRRYLHVAARNRALKYLRHRRVADGWLERVNRDPTPRLETPEDVCLRRELDAAVQRAIAELPERCRATFLLRRREGLSYEAIAARRGVTLGTVKSQMWRAAVLLRSKLAAFIL